VSLGIPIDFFHPVVKNFLHVDQTTDGSGSKIFENFFEARVRLGQPSMVWVWVWKISPKYFKFYFSLRVKKISTGWVKKYLGQRQVGFLFTAGQKYARVGSGPISTNPTPPVFS